MSPVLRVLQSCDCVGPTGGGSILLANIQFLEVVGLRSFFFFWLLAQGVLSLQRFPAISCHLGFPNMAIYFIICSQCGNIPLYWVSDVQIEKQFSFGISQFCCLGSWFCSLSHSSLFMKGSLCLHLSFISLLLTNRILGILQLPFILYSFSLSIYSLSFC